MSFLHVKIQSLVKIYLCGFSGPPKASRMYGSFTCHFHTTKSSLSSKYIFSAVFLALPKMSRLRGPHVIFTRQNTTYSRKRTSRSPGRQIHSAVKKGRQIHSLVKSNLLVKSSSQIHPLVKKSSKKGDNQKRHWSYGRLAWQYRFMRRREEYMSIFDEGACLACAIDV